MRDIKPIIGYVHTGIEKTCRGQVLLEGHPGHRADGLPRVLLQRDGVLRGGRDAARPRGPAARAVPARDPPRAQPDHVAPRVARDQRARPRRDLDVLVLLPRPRADPRPVRDVLRPAHAHALLPGRRRHRGHPAPASSRRSRSSPTACPTRIDQFADAARQERDRARSACADVAAVDEETLLGLGVTGPLLRADRQPVGPAQGRARTRATTTSTSRSRSAPSATTTTATACGWPR